MSLLDTLTGFIGRFSPQPTPQPRFSPNMIGDPRDMKLTIPGTLGAQSPSPSASPSPVGSPSPSPDALEAVLRQGIDRWSSGRNDVPILDQISLFADAGRQLQAQGYDPYLPTILALRETQGGRDNRKPGAITGQHNVLNIRGQQGGQTQFIDYPDIHTSLFGGPNGPDTSQGLVKLLTENPIYADYQRTKDPRDLWKRWSPPVDNNGSLDEQVANYEWFRRQFEGQ